MGITVQQTVSLDDGGTDWSLFYYFDISTTPIIDNAGGTLAVQNSSQLPPVAVKFLSQSQKDAIDAGNAGFLQRTIRQTPGETQANFISRAEIDYAAVKAYWLAKEQAIYSKQGLQRDL